MAEAQDIRTDITVFDNVGNSQLLQIGINSSATDGIDPGLGEFMLGPTPPPGVFDARLIDNDLRSPSLLGNGVWLDLRGIFTPQPITQVFEVRARRAAAASVTYMSWPLPFAVGIATARLNSYPDPTIVNVDMFSTGQVVLPIGVNRYFVTVTYGTPPPPRYTLNTQVAPPGTGMVIAIPFQPDYQAGSTVTLVATPTDTCYRFSHWTGDASGTNPVINITMDASKNVTARFVKRTFPVTVSTLSPFIVVPPGIPPPQLLTISNSGLACYKWTASATVPWITLAPANGTGDGSITVGIVSSMLPCPGTHLGTIEITSDASTPTTISVPVTAIIGSSSLSATTYGTPVILNCQPKANDLIFTTIFNNGLTPVTFPVPPVPGPGFTLKNPGAFPMTVPAQDSATLYFEFAPLPSQSGLIVENIVLAGASCGQQVLIQLQGTRIAPSISADVTELDFGAINACPSDPLPTRSITLYNAHVQPALLTYITPPGMTLVAAPAAIGGLSSAVVVVEPTRNGVQNINQTLVITADYTVCSASLDIALHGRRQNPAFTAEAVATPGSLPPQVFDTTCVGGYSSAKGILIRNTGDADLNITLNIAAPYVIDAFSNTFPLPAGQAFVVNIRFHPTVAGTFTQPLNISADLCDLIASTTLEGTTYDQQILSSALVPSLAIVANCDTSVRIKLSIENTGTQNAVFSQLPPLPSGFYWDAGISLPITILPGPSNLFEAYIVFQPPFGQGGSFGGSVQWFGQPCGTTVYFTLNGQRSLPVVTVSSLDTFFVAQTPPPTQMLYISNLSGLTCYQWTAVPTVPWLSLWKSSGNGDDSISVGILTSAIPCQGTHAGKILVSLDANTTFEVPVVLVVGKSDVTASVLGAPVLLSCQAKANDLIIVTISNDGLGDVLFPAPPATGPGFILKNPGAFPLMVPAKDSANLFYEFAPLPQQRGVIVDNVILTASACGKQVLFKLEGTRIAPIVTTDTRNIDFGRINACPSDPLPNRSITLTNDYSTAAVLRYNIPPGYTLLSAPPAIPASSTQTVTIEPSRTGPAEFSDTLVIEADFGICSEFFRIAMHGRRQAPSFRAEAVALPGTLPPQVFDTTCIGAYSPQKAIRIVNDGTADLTFTISIASPFEIDAFNSTFRLLAGEEKTIGIRFHPTAAGTFNQTLNIAADLCNLSATVSLRGATYSQQNLSATLSPTDLRLENCEVSGKIRLRIVNTSAQTAVFDSLPNLPTGFRWDAGVTAPVVIAPGIANAMEAFIVFEPPLGAQEQFGGSVQWFGSPCGTTVTFVLNGERVLPAVSVNPSLLDFGTLVWCETQADSPIRIVTMRNDSPIPVTVTAAAPASRYALTYGALPFPSQGLQLAPNSTLDFDVQAKPGSGGSFADSLVVTVTAGAGGTCSRVYRIALVGERYKPGFLVKENEASSDFGDVCVNTTETRLYVIENNGDKALTVSAANPPAQSPFQFLTTPFRLRVEPGQSKVFAVRFTPKQTGRASQDLGFTSDACPETTTFTVSGNGVQPSFDVTAVDPPGPVNILSCALGISRQFRATITNTGGDPITVTDGSVPPVGFVYDPAGQFPFTLAPNQSHDVVLRLTTTQPGTYGGIVTVSGRPCELTVSFAVQARILDTRYTITPDHLDFGDIFVCPSGDIREADMERLTQELEFYNAGEVPLGVAIDVVPPASPVQRINPPVSPILVAAGQMSKVKVAILPPLDSTLGFISGAVQFVVMRDSLCPPEITPVPFSGRVQRVNFHFQQDTLKAISRCATEPVEMQARLINRSTLPITFSLVLEGPSAFRIADSASSILLQPGGSRQITIRYTPDSTAGLTARLLATDDQCRWTIALPIEITIEATEIALGCGSIPGTPPVLTGRPGDIVEIPFFLLDGLACFDSRTALTLEVQFDVYGLSPRQVVATQGKASMRRTAPDKVLVTFFDGSFLTGELGKLRMEVLIGRTKSTPFAVQTAAFTPAVANVLLDQSCAGTVNVLPRNGITTLDDLGIAQITPPHPNTLGPTTSHGTTIDIVIPKDAYVEMKLVNGLGVEVDVIKHGWMERGTYSIPYQPPPLPAGMYLVTLVTGSERLSQKLLIAR